MTEAGTVLAVDQGGQSTRAIVFDPAGRGLHAHREPIATYRHGDGFIEHDPEELLQSVHNAVTGATDRAGPVAAVGLATQRSSIVCWDRDTGAALSPVISWQDRRAAGILHRCAPPAESVRRITGLVRSPHYGASKLRWCLDNLPGVAGAQAAGRLAMGPLSSFLLFRLLDQRPFVADPSNASRTLLWDVVSGDWSGEMLDAFGIARSVLPRCVDSRYDYGYLDSADAPLFVCTGDQGAAVFADGPLPGGAGRINIGTGAFLLTPIARAPAATRLLHSIVWRDGNTVCRVLEGTVNGAGSALAEFGADHAAIAAAAARIGGTGIPLFLNGTSGLGSPWWREDFTSRFVGDRDAGGLTAVIESVLFLLRANLDEMSRSVAIDRLQVSGGLAQVDAICQGLADLSGLPVRRSTDGEATARGLAFLTAGQPAGWRAAPHDHFDPRRRPVLTDRYVEWLAALEAAL